MKARPLSDPAIANHLARARLHALSDMPYLASALTAMTFLEVEGLGTVGIDDRLRTYVDPVTVMHWTVPQLAGALLHEANHFLRGHHARAPFDPWGTQRWNIAGDLEINDDLTVAGIELPDGALQSELFGLPVGRTAEWYYDRLPQQRSESVVCMCGSAATGVALPWETSDPRSGVSISRAISIVETVADAIRHAPPGTTPGGLARWAQAAGSAVPWTRILRHAVRDSVARTGGQSDYSWTLPNRRHRGRVILPRLRSARVSVLCVVDTSGSMSQADVDAALGEVDAICSCMSVERAFIASCDADATFHGEFRSLTSIELVGGGGTTLEKALDLIKEHHLKPDVVVFLTDGQTQWSESPPISLSGARAIVVTPEGAQPGPDWALTLHNGM